MTRTLIDNYRAGTSVLDFEIVRILRKDLFKVAATDLEMYLAGYFCVALQWAIRAGFIRWRTSGWIIQNVSITKFHPPMLHANVLQVFQTFFLFFFIWLAKHRNYPWIGCVFLLLHSLVLIMKMHSYAFYNGYLWNTLEDLHLVEGKLKKLQDCENKDGSTAATEEFLELHKFLREELAAQSTTTPFPANLSLCNYFEYSMFPTLVYQIDYPRTNSINWSYVGEKIAAVFGVFFLMIVLAEKYLYPIAMEAIELRSMPFMEKVFEYPLVLLNLTLPFVLMYLLVFYIIWDAILNAIAELTCFSDREFYGPWWNSVTWDQFARDWNVPVHRFLLRHVYHSSISTFNVSKKAATRKCPAKTFPFYFYFSLTTF
jgi:sterol O-acyltransferase